mgnify:CR=1 FL=1
MAYASTNTLTMRYFFVFLLLPFLTSGQKGKISGSVKIENRGIAGAMVFTKDGKSFTETSSDGRYSLTLPYGTYTLVAFAEGYNQTEITTTLQNPQSTLDIELSILSKELDEVKINAERERTFGITRLRSVEGLNIFEAKKSEVIVLKDMTANLATNNARQVFAKVPGLNIWENDGAGLQLGIGGRGLSPNRTANFNTRQNGYDIAADALGYPESYYTPPTESLERIEVVRGAASLQYGTQFGGLLNFKIKKGPTDQKISLTSRQTVGSWNFLNSFNSLGGQIGKLNYYTFYQRKQGDGWRPNSQFAYDMAYGGVIWKPTEKLAISGDFTYMNYLAKQPGGLTDAFFKQNPRQSLRSRNWFAIDWNLASLTLDYTLTAKTKMNTRFFGISARRQSLGNLERISVADFGQNRDLIDGLFQNIGNETRLIHYYKTGTQNAIFLTGVRLYRGNARSQQGEADATDLPNFSFLNPTNLEDSDFLFPSRNYSFFIENIFNLTDKWSVTPGFRWENIQTFSEGYFKQRVFDAAGNLLVDRRIEETQSRLRSFPIFGIGISYKATSAIEWYGNISQNYRAINFNDIRINNPNIQIDPNIQDEKGFSADFGARGNLADGKIQFDASLFYLRYNDRIGLLLRSDQPPLFLDYRFRTNISDARNIGIESFIESDLMRWFLPKPNYSLNVFTNFSLINARYVNTDEPSIRGRQVELVPAVMVRSGLSFVGKKWKATYQYNFTAKQFTDATNAIRSSSAVNGLIPAYQIMDLSTSYQLSKRWVFEASVNNLLNTAYFTRRADAYPGPGIIPSDGRAFFLTVGFTW